MKYKICFLLIIFVMALSVSANAESTTEPATESTNSISEEVEDALDKSLEKFGNQSDDSIGGVAARFERWYTEKLAGFARVEEAIKNSQNHFSYINVPQISKFLTTIFLPISYAVLFISWCASMSKKSIMLDIYEPKEFIKGGSSLVMGLVLISLSVKLMELIFAITNGITLEIANASGSDIFNYTSKFMMAYEKSDLWIIGPIINFINFLTHLPTVVIAGLLNYFVSIIISVVLCIRLIKIAIFQGISPLMIGLYAGESTAPYAKNFLIEYIKLAAQGVIIAVVFYIYKKAFVAGVGIEQYIETMNNPSAKWGQSIFPIITIALAIMVLNSGKLLDKIVGRA